MAKRTKPQPDQSEEIVRANINRQIELSTSHVSLYANDTQIQITPWDFRFMFGVVEDPPNAERRTVLIKQLAEIRMSPQHAKIVAQVLMRQVQNYERVVGQIPTPNDATSAS